MGFYRKYPGRSARILKELRAKALTHLGGKCVRCGFSDRRALQIDHVNGDGYRFKGNNRNYYALYNDVLTDRTGKYQCLCANCNWIKRAENKEFGGIHTNSQMDASEATVNKVNSSF